MKKLSSTLFVFLSAVFISASISAASIDKGKSYINLGTIYSSTYDIKWSAETTAKSTAYEVSVYSSVYFNGKRQGIAEGTVEYNTKSVDHGGKKSGSKSVKGTWELFSDHYVKLTKDSDKERKDSYDYVYWDPTIDK